MPKEIYYELVLALIPVLACWVLYLIHQLARYMSTRRRSAWLDSYLQGLELAVDGAVKSVMPLVEEAKQRNRDGRLTSQQAQEYKREAMTRVKLQLNSEARKILELVYSDLDTMLAQRVESYVYQIKSSIASRQYSQ
jgi:vacuolar-type H+-ATPase subunit H